MSTSVIKQWTDYLGTELSSVKISLNLKYQIIMKI